MKRSRPTSRCSQNNGAKQASPAPEWMPPRRPRAPVSLGQSAAWAAPAGHTQSGVFSTQADCPCRGGSGAGRGRGCTRRRCGVATPRRRSRGRGTRGSRRRGTGRCCCRDGANPNPNLNLNPGTTGRGESGGISRLPPPFLPAVCESPGVCGPSSCTCPLRFPPEEGEFSTPWSACYLRILSFSQSGRELL